MGDSHRLSEQQGRIPDELWARKEYPVAVSRRVDDNEEETDG